MRLVGALEEHVLDEVRDAAAARRVSWRDPRVSQTPMLTERTCGIGSVRRRRPLSRTSRDDRRIRQVSLAAALPDAPNGAQVLYGKELRDRRLILAWLDASHRRSDRLGLRARSTMADPQRDSPGPDHDDHAASISRTGAGELEAALEPLGMPRFHAPPDFRWIYRRGVTDFAR